MLRFRAVRAIFDSRTCRVRAPTNPSASSAEEMVGIDPAWSCDHGNVAGIPADRNRDIPTRRRRLRSARSRTVHAPMSSTVVAKTWPAEDRRPIANERTIRPGSRVDPAVTVRIGLTASRGRLARIIPSSTDLHVGTDSLTVEEPNVGDHKPRLPPVTMLRPVGCGCRAQTKDDDRHREHSTGTFCQPRQFDCLELGPSVTRKRHFLCLTPRIVTSLPCWVGGR